MQVRAGLGWGQRCASRLSVSGHSWGTRGAHGQGDMAPQQPAHPLPPQFFLQEDEVADRRAEEPAAPAALPGSPPEPRGGMTPKEAQASR